MNDLSKRWNDYSKESKILHKEYYIISEEFHQLLINNPKDIENLKYLREKIVSIENQIDSLKDKYYEPLYNSLYRPQ